MSESKDVLRKPDNAVASVTKGSDQKEEMMMMIVSAPLSIALLGELILISAESDFSLGKRQPKGGFKHLRYPSSFRACLVQMSDACWEAFNEARSNMDQIRLLSGNVDVHVRNAVKFLVHGNDKGVEIMGPKILNDVFKNVERIADECVSLVTSVEDKFLGVLKLIVELLEACTNARGQYEEDLRETKIAIKVAQKQFDEMKKDMKCQQMMKVSSMPSGWDLLGMKLVEFQTSAVTNTSNVFSSDVFRKSPRLPSTHIRVKDYEETNTGREAAHERTNRRIYSKVPLLMAQVIALDSLFNGDQPIWEEIKKNMGFIQATLERIQGDIDDLDDTPVRKQVSDLCLLAVQVCIKLGQASKDFSRDEGEVRKTVRWFKKLRDDVDVLDVQAKHATGANSMAANCPHLSKVQSAGGASTRLMKSEIDFEKILETLIKSLKPLAKLREQWSKMVRFFQFFNGFIKSTKPDQQMTLEGASLSNVMRDMIYERAFQASTIPHVVQMISETYVEISNQHLMDRITCLGHLVGLNPKTDEHEILKKRLELLSVCEAAQKAIGKLVMEKKRDSNEQMAKIERQMKDTLPARSPAATDVDQFI